MRENGWKIRFGTAGESDSFAAQGYKSSLDIPAYTAGMGLDAFEYQCGHGVRLGLEKAGKMAAAAREAAFLTRSRKIGVIGTAATIRSRSYEALLRRLVPGVELTTRACPLFVPLVESGYVDGSAPDCQQVTRLVIRQYLTELRQAGVDTLILGCTHYPLIKGMIGEFMGPQVSLVDPGQAAAHHLEQLLAEKGLRASRPAGQARYYVSDTPDSFAQTADLFLREYRGGRVEQIAIDKY